MNAPFVPALDTFQGGQMTDLPSFASNTFDGTELFEIVSGTPSATTAATAVNYSITSASLASGLVRIGQLQVVISQGQNTSIGDPFIIPLDVARVYVNKVTPEPTFIKVDGASGYLIDVLVKDIAGTADGAGSGIFLLGTADGITNPTITVPYGGFFFRPVISLNIWTLGTS